MRIIAGEYRSRTLEAPAGLATRPTSDRLRETLFNVLTPRMEGAVFLDLYAGSGAVGIEALSRGAASVDFVERASDAIRVLRKNLARLGITEGFRVHTVGVGAWLRRVARKGASDRKPGMLSPTRCQVRRAGRRPHRLRPSDSQLPLAQVFEVQVIVEAVHRALAPVARFLDAAKGRCFGGQRAFVDADDAGLRAPRPRARCGTLRSNRCTPPGRTAWRSQRRSLLLGLEARYRHDRAEGLLAGAGHRGVSAGQQCRREVVGPRAVSRCPPTRRARPAHGVAHMAPDLVHGLGIDHRPDSARPRRCRADLQRRDRAPTLGEAVVDPRLHEHRFGLTHVWPPLRNFAAISPSTAASTLASSKTMNGALPPSSSDSFFSVSALRRARCLPTGVEPVKRDLAHARVVEPDVDHLGRALARGGDDVQHARGHARPSASSTRASEVSGVSSAGLATTVQPAASAGAILRGSSPPEVPRRDHRDTPTGSCAHVRDPAPAPG